MELPARARSRPACRDAHEQRGSTTALGSRGRRQRACDLTRPRGRVLGQRRAAPDLAAIGPNRCPRLHRGAIRRPASAVQSRSDRPLLASARPRSPRPSLPTAGRPRSPRGVPPPGRPDAEPLSGARRRRPRHDRLAREAPRLRLPSSEIYGGINAVWDYGPLGVELKNNVKRAWWRAMVQERDDIVGLDAGHPHAPPGVGDVRPRRVVQRPAGRVRDRPSPLPARRAAGRGGPVGDRPAGPDASSSGSA